MSLRVAGVHPERRRDELSRAQGGRLAQIGGPGEDVRTCPSVNGRDAQAEQKGESFPVVMR